MLIAEIKNNLITSCFNLFFNLNLKYNNYYYYYYYYYYLTIVNSLLCLTRDREAAGSSLTGVTVLWSLRKTHLS